MRSTMLDAPLQLRRILEHATSFGGAGRLVTAVHGGHRQATYAEVGRNAARLAHALRALGIRGPSFSDLDAGDRFAQALHVSTGAQDGTVGSDDRGAHMSAT